MAAPKQSTDELKQDNTASDKVMIVLTGSTGAIGGELAAELVSKPNTSLHLLVRNENKIKKLIENTLNKALHKSSCIEYHIVDLSSKKSLNSFVSTFNKQYSYVDILINNAGIVPNDYHQTEDGEELQFSVNVMSYMRLMYGLLPLLINSGKDQQRRQNIPQLLEYGDCAKIINVASQYTRALGENLEKSLNLSAANANQYDLTTQYQQCKAANRMTSAKAGEIFKDKGYNVAVYSCHPGVVTSNLLSGLGWEKGFDSVSSGVKTPLYCALNGKEVNMKQTGLFYHTSKVKDCEYCKDKDKVQKLWDYCMKIL